MNDCYVNANAMQDFDEQMHRKGYTRAEDCNKLIQYYKQEVINLNEQLMELRSRAGLYENLLNKIKQQNEDICKTIYLFTAKY